MIPDKSSLVHLSTRQRMSPFPNYLSMECITDEMENTLGMSYNFVIMIFRENMMYVFLKKEEYEKVGEYALRKVIDDPSFFHKIVSVVDKKGKKFIEFLKNLEDVSNYSNEDIVTLNNNYQKNYKTIYSNYFTILAAENNLSKYLKEYLNKLVSDEKKREEYFSILVTEPRAQVTGQENYAALKLAKKILENTVWKEYFEKENAEELVRKDKELNSLFLEHEKSFFWITRDYEDPVLTYSDFVSRMKTILSDLPIEKLKEKEESLKSVDENIKSIENKIGIDKNHSKMFSAMREGLHLKELRKAYVSQSLFYYDKILLEIGRRNNLSIREVRHMKIGETKEIFNDKNLQEEIKERVKLSAWIIKDKKTMVVTGKKAEEYYDTLLKFDSDIKELKGIPASPGIVEGPVRIVMNPSELHKMKDGDIMVSGQIVPSFTPGLKKAKGLVCDGGTGITSHPATLAREAGIPCVTLTKIATQVLKDGDMIRVDGYKGIVEIIKKV